MKKYLTSMQIQAIANYIFQTLKKEIKSAIYNSGLYQADHIVGMNHNDGQGNVFFVLYFYNDIIKLTSSKHHYYEYKYYDPGFLDDLFKKVHEILEVL